MSATSEALINEALLSYRSRNFLAAIGQLLNVLDMEPRQWRAKLYLAMCYFHVGDVWLSVHHFRSISNHCPDAEIRNKADSAIASLNAQ